jgi:hypothetical protein
MPAQQRLSDSSVLDPHRGLGTGLQVIALVILIVALVARRQIRESIALFVLMALQSVWAAGGSSAPFLGGIHVLGGVAILGLTFEMHRRARGSAASG